MTHRQKRVSHPSTALRALLLVALLVDLLNLIFCLLSPCSVSLDTVRYTHTYTNAHLTSTRTHTPLSLASLLALARALLAALLYTLLCFLVLLFALV